MKDTILVLANRTAASDALFAALRARDERRPARFELVVPADHPREEAERRLVAALERAADHNLEITGSLGDADALVAVTEAYDARRHDEIFISTLPMSVSHWLRIDLPARVGHATGALVTHVVAADRPRAYAPQTGHGAAPARA